MTLRAGLAIGLILLMSRVPTPAPSLVLEGPDRDTLTEAQSYDITWRASGIRTVGVTAYGDRTPLGGRSRGTFNIRISDPVPASQGRVSWKPPLIDARKFRIRVAGYDSEGRTVRSFSREYEFRPVVMVNRSADGIYLDLHTRNNQRLYVQKDGRITKVYLSSSSENWEWQPRNSHPGRMHDHGGIFRVLSKERNHYSSLFRVDMPYAMRYHGGHYIHATSPSLYDSLGEPASAGCNRLTLEDARELYSQTPIGTRVEVIGPEGILL